MLLREPSRGRTVSVKDIVILGGPNGAGKTTAAQVLLPQELDIREFGRNCARAFAFQCHGCRSGSRQAYARKDAHSRPRRPELCFRDNLLGPDIPALASPVQTEGWRVTLVYLWLPSPQAALDRVARRVRVPADVVVRRYWAGLADMRHRYLPLVDVAAIYDNSDHGRVLIAEQTPGIPLEVWDATRWAMFDRITP
jgi:predicted ABC-type ATPase